MRLRRAPPQPTGSTLLNFGNPTEFVRILFLLDTGYLIVQEGGDFTHLAAADNHILAAVAYYAHGRNYRRGTRTETFLQSAVFVSLYSLTL